MSLQGGRLPPLYHGVTRPLFLFITSFSPFANHLSPPSSYFCFSFSTVHRRPRSPAFLMSSSHCFHFSRSDRTFAFNRLIQIQIPNPQKKKNLRQQTGIEKALTKKINSNKRKQTYIEINTHSLKRVNNGMDTLCHRNLEFAALTFTFICHYAASRHSRPLAPTPVLPPTAVRTCKDENVQR